MVWEKNGESWVGLGIRAQESVVLVDANGQVIKSWTSTPANLDDILAELR